MALKSYGVGQQNQPTSSMEYHLEELQIQGYTILPNIADATRLEEIRQRLDAVYTQQEAAFGKENLVKIKELNLARCLLAHDDFFLELVTEPILLDFVEKVLGSYYVLHLQNGVINQPNQEHHQSSWHRDLPYQDWVISKPLAVNCFWCIDPFSSETGGTWLLPFSHRLDYLPSEAYMEKHAVQLEAPAGSVVLFDSMLYHAAGYNRSQQIRRGINHVYVAPIIKQQIDIPEALGGKWADDPFLAMVLGYSSKLAGSVEAYRKNRL